MRCFIKPNNFFHCKYVDRTGHASCQPELHLSEYYPTRRQLPFPEQQDILNNVFYVHVQLKVTIINIKCDARNWVCVALMKRHHHS